MVRLPDSMIQDFSSSMRSSPVPETTRIPSGLQVSWMEAIMLKQRAKRLTRIMDYYGLRGYFPYSTTQDFVNEFSRRKMGVFINDSPSIDCKQKIYERIEGRLEVELGSTSGFISFCSLARLCMLNSRKVSRKIWLLIFSPSRIKSRMQISVVGLIFADRFPFFSQFNTAAWVTPNCWPNFIKVISKNARIKWTSCPVKEKGLWQRAKRASFWSLL